MSSILADDIRVKYEKSFDTIKGIVDAFPEDKWLVPHGDVYYIPSRIAYHLATYIDGSVAGSFKDPNFRNNLPFGNWMEGTAETLPDKAAFLAYFNTVITKANETLAPLTDDDVTAATDPNFSWFGKTQLGVHLSAMREIAAHTGELNKMLIENGKDDVWF